jgi:hypothetical protein
MHNFKRIRNIILLTCTSFKWGHLKRITFHGHINIPINCFWRKCINFFNVIVAFLIIPSSYISFWISQQTDIVLIETILKVYYGYDKYSIRILWESRIYTKRYLCNQSICPFYIFCVPWYFVFIIKSPRIAY